MIVNDSLKAGDLKPKLERFWKISGEKIRSLESYDHDTGAPVYTVKGRYTSRSWTDWTRGFVFGSAILQYDAVGDEKALSAGRAGTDRYMRNYITHTGVHDHGFNIISTFGNLRRLAGEGRIQLDTGEGNYIETALRASGAVQASRWTDLPDGGFIPSFNGPHSLFADTVRTLRSLALSHSLGHTLLGENDRHISLFHRLVQHARTTARYAVYYGEGRDSWDEWGRVAHESLFNVRDGAYRAPATQQGYSGFSTWTRGLAWILSGYPELLEYLEVVPEADYPEGENPESVTGMMLRAARASADFFIANTATDGVPYWDTGAPGLSRMDGWRERPADPFNDHEPVDSSAAAISCQGLMRLGQYLGADGDGRKYFQAGLTVLSTLLEEPYLSIDPAHQGLLLHSVYHRPNGWDYVPEGASIPFGEACMWGDYHLREAALYAGRIAAGGPRHRFFTGVAG